MLKAFEIPPDYEKVPFPDVVYDESGAYGWKKIADFPEGAIINLPCPYCHELLGSTKEHLLQAAPMRCHQCHQFFAYVPEK